MSTKNSGSTDTTVMDIGDVDSSNRHKMGNNQIYICELKN